LRRDRSELVTPIPADYADAVERSAFTLPSFAKINLHLKIVGKRDDVYHELCTVFQTVSLHDEVHFERAERLSLTCDIASVPTNDQNLIMKAARALQKRSGISMGARLRLVKRVPTPGGLGGGSSNAAIALLGLVRLWGIRNYSTDLHELAAEIGSDVPFFLCGGTALGLGRGTEIVPLPGCREKYLLIVTPHVTVSTAEVFSRVNAHNLTSVDSNRILQICRFEAESHVLRYADLRNDLEKVTFKQYPEVAAAKKALLELGARQALMSGSGASVFGIFEKEETRQAAMKALDKQVNWRKFAVATVSRKQYREALNLVF
jgi:4-diphosphocytidyl-2-C-methyl-D-erythritol kinase